MVKRLLLLALLCTASPALAQTGPGPGPAPFSGSATPSGAAGGSLGGTYPNPTVVTNANLAGPIGSTGNTTTITSQTGTGTKFVVDTSPTLVTPILGVAAATSLNLTGSTTTPMVTVGSNANSGMGSAGAAGDRLDFWISNVLLIHWDAPQFRFGSAQIFGWSSNTNPSAAGFDTAFSRDSAGVIDVGTGAAANTAGSMKMATATFTTVASDTATADATACLRSSDGLLLKGTGTIGICLGTSSARYKHSITALKAGLSSIMRLSPVRYMLDADPTNKPFYGFLAEAMHGPLPELVGMDNSGAPNTADYLGLVPVLVKAIQEQQAEINALKHALRR